MTQDTTTPALAGVRHNDPFLVRALQAIAVCGVLLGLVLYGWFAVRSEGAASRASLAEAAAAGQIAAEAELARIELVADRAAPLIASILETQVSAGELREAHARISGILSSTPVTAIAVLDGRGGVRSVFGQMPADAAGRLSPPVSSQRAGQELVGLDMVPVSSLRAAYYRTVGLADGTQVPVALVLRSGAFRAALTAGATSGQRGRAALINSEGDILLASTASGRGITSADRTLVARAAGWQPLHSDEALEQGRIAGQVGGALLEARSAAGGRLQLVYLHDVPSLGTVIVSRKWELIALLGASLLSLALALSLIQNEWRREDSVSEDTFLVLAQARASCDLLNAGVIDWSVTDGRVTYSDGWAEMFARGQKPLSEEAHDWIARIHPDDQDAARETYQRMLDGAADEIDQLIRIRLPSGIWAQVLERGRTIRGSDGMPARIVLVQTPEAADGRALMETLGDLAKARSVALAG